MDKPYSIVLVDDHIVLRGALKSLIERLGNYVVTGEYDNGELLVRNIQEIDANLIVLDLDMPVMNGETTMKWLKKNNVAIPVLVMTYDTSDAKIISLYNLGARGYLPKAITEFTLKKAIEDVLTTGYYHNELVSNALKSKNSGWQLTGNHLSEREMEFLQLVCHKDEYTYEEIAKIMRVNRRTVEGYREHIFDKFEIRSKTGLVMYAIKHGLVKL